MRLLPEKLTSSDWNTRRATADLLYLLGICA
jgi:hypothetical protein